MLLYLTTISGLIILMILSRKENGPNDAVYKENGTEKYAKIFWKPARLIYRTIFHRKGQGKRRIRAPSIDAAEREMYLLYPSDTVLHVREYQIANISKAMFLLALGSCLAIAFSLSMKADFFLTAEGWVRRGALGEDSRRIGLTARIEGIEDETMDLEVEPVRYSGEELDAMSNEAIPLLEREILNGNESPDRVSGSLHLIKELDGLPFVIDWECSNYALIDSDGEVHSEQAAEEGEVVEMKAVLHCYDRVYEHIFPLRVVRPVLSEQEDLRKRLEDSVRRAEEKDRTQDTFQLPKLLDGKAIVWSEIKQDMSPWIFVLTLAAVAVSFKAQEKDLHKKIEEKEKELRLSYPDLISRLILLLGAGLPIREALFQMASDYQKRRQKGMQAVYAYEELVLICREMKSGVTETAALEHYGDRCRLSCYKKCTALLSQNLRKGSSGLLNSLQAEAKEAFEDRKAVARRMGEEAGTKLLLPMILMLLVVMVLIMVPACFSFAGM